MSALGAQDWRPEFAAANQNLPRWFLDDRTDLTARLAELHMPVLLLWDDADPISPVRVGQRLAELLPRAELHVFPGGGHDLGFTYAVEVAASIDRHLALPLQAQSSGASTRVAHDGLLDGELG